MTEDPETNEPLFPDETAIQWLKSRLAKRSGMPVATIREELASRLARAGAAGRLAAGGQPDESTAKRTPSRPTLTDNERTFLSFLSAHPDVPVHQVYKGVGIKAAEITKLRERLTDNGLVQELDMRTGVGRPTKFLIPTFAALELLGIDPPPGRGSLLHRHIQQVVKEGATAKGYTAKVEQVIGNGAIVDVHLEKGKERIAVEIAIASRLELEFGHIRHCLTAGYDRVFGIFADETLLSRTAQLLGEACSRDEQAKVRLLPLGRLSQVG